MRSAAEPGSEAALKNTLQDADSAAALARQRYVNELTDGSSGSPEDESHLGSAATPTETTAQASLRVFLCDRRTLRLLRVPLTIHLHYCVY